MLILSAIGHDRPGIVAGISQVLYQHGCNLEDSSMTRLAGEFACILILTAPAGLDIKVLHRSLEDLAQAMGLTLQLRALEQSAPRPAVAEHEVPYIVSVYGADQPGIVYKVVAILASMQINITDVVTRRVPLEGDRGLYQLLLEVEIPLVVQVFEVERALAELAEELGVRLTLKPVESVEL